MWDEQPFEVHVRARLKEKCGQAGEGLWASYVKTREELISEILPYIAAQEPNLTDHGVDHIANVIGNVGTMLAIPKITPDGTHRQPVNDLNPKELLLLLMGCLLHDVGNIAGRSKHNITGAQVWQQAGTSYNLWKGMDRRTILAICRAHTGKNLEGGTDTLGSLSLQSHYFANEPVRATELAAVVRFADELAEGPQRTSNYLLSQGLYSEESRLYHQYASSTHVVIDRGSNRIALTYDIDLSGSLFSQPETARGTVDQFLHLLYSRVLKLEHERVFARHYAPSLIPFRETSVAIHFNRKGTPTPPELSPLILNDFNARSNDTGIISQIDSAYEITSITDILFPGAE